MVPRRRRLCRDRAADRRTRRGKAGPRLRDRRPHPRRAQGRRHHLGGRAGRHYLAARMTEPLYTTEILRLAASLKEPHELEREDGRAELRSPTCGSRISLAVQLDEERRVERLSIKVHACAFGQASAALVEKHGPGRSHDEVSASLLAL